MHIYLAEYRDGSAETILGLLIILGGIVLACTFVVLAFKKRTVGWIISGLVSGILLLIFLAGAVGGVVDHLMFRYKVYNYNAQSQQASPTPSSVVPIVPPTVVPKPPAIIAPAQIVRGRDVGFTLRVPAEWNVKRQTTGFDVIAQYKSVSVGVIAEEANVGSPENVALFAIQHIKKSATNVSVSDAVYVTVDGHKWIRSLIDCTQNGIPIRYILFFYSGVEGSYQVVAWGVPNLIEKYAVPVDGLMRSFEFPK